MDSKEMAPGDIERHNRDHHRRARRPHVPPLEGRLSAVKSHHCRLLVRRFLVFTHDAAHCALDALRAGATVLTDTNMALAGISKPALMTRLQGRVLHNTDLMSPPAACAAGTTRAVASMDKACDIEVRSSWPSATLTTLLRLAE